MSNNTWNGYMKHLVSNEADLSAAKMTHDAGRITDANPGFSLDHVYFEVIFWKSLNKGSGWTFFLESFDISTWLTISALLLIVFILLLMTNLVQPKSSLSLQLQYGLLILKSLFAESHDISKEHEMPLWSSSMILFIMSLTGSIMFMAYTGILTSIIAVQKVTPPFTSLKELATLSDFKLGTQAGSATNEMRQAIIKNKDDYKDMYEYFIKPYEDIMIAEPFIESNKVPNAGYFTISTLDFYSPMQRIDTCDLMKVPMKEFRTTTVGWMYPKDSMLQPMFDRFMRQLYRNGVIYKINNKYLQKEAVCKDDGYPQTGFDVIGILFLVLLIGISTAIILALYEKIKFSCMLLFSNGI